MLHERGRNWFGGDGKSKHPSSFLYTFSGKPPESAGDEDEDEKNSHLKKYHPIIKENKNRE